MPLIKSKSKEAVGENIAREEDAGRPRKQAIAVALDVQRRAGGHPAKAHSDADHARHRRAAKRVERHHHSSNGYGS